MHEEAGTSTPLGRAIVLPVRNPASTAGLVRLAARVAARESGTVVPVRVVAPSAGRAERAEAHEMVVAAEQQAQAAGVAARGIVCTHTSVASGVLEAAVERQASLVVMGWRGDSTVHNVFGEIIDSIVGRSCIPLAVARLPDGPYGRVLQAVSDDHLLPAGERGLRLAATLADTLADDGVIVLRAGDGWRTLPACLDGRPVYTDPRRIDLAVGTAVSAGDLVVTSVAPTTSGLRAATTHIAWAAPEAGLLVAFAGTNLATASAEGELRLSGQGQGRP